MGIKATLQDTSGFDHLHTNQLRPTPSLPMTISHSAKLHVVMVPYPVQGHINPMVQFAKGLIRQDTHIMVTLVTNKHNHDRIQLHTARSSTGSTQATAPAAAPVPPPQSKLQFVWVDNGLPSDFDYSDILLGFPEFHLATYKMKEPLKDLLQNLHPPVSCVVFGCFCPWAQSVAAELGIPNVLFMTQSTTIFSIYYHLPLLVSNGFFPYRCKDQEGQSADSTEMVSYIPGIPPLHPSRFPTLIHIDDITSPDFEALVEQFAMVKNLEGVIINSFEELEKDAFQALQAQLPFPIFLVGPLLPSAFLDGRDMTDTSIGASLLQEKNDCMKWLDSKEQHSVIYISFGSIFNPSAEDLEGIALGMKASKQPFLWVIRPRSSLHDVSEILPKDFIQDTKDYGLIIPWAPQLQVLSHPSVGAFLTHCGWNSTLESLSMGVPMMVAPLKSDQPTNGTFVCEVWKVGMALKKHNVDIMQSEDVERVVRAVLQGQEEGKQMRERAGKLRASARLAVQAEGSSTAHTQKFIQTLRNITVKANNLHI